MHVNLVLVFDIFASFHLKSCDYIFKTAYSFPSLYKFVAFGPIVPDQAKLFIFGGD